MDLCELVGGEGSGTAVGRGSELRELLVSYGGVSGRIGGREGEGEGEGEREGEGEGEGPGGDAGGAGETRDETAPKEQEVLHKQSEGTTDSAELEGAKTGSDEGNARAACTCTVEPLYCGQEKVSP